MVSFFRRRKVEEPFCVLCGRQRAFVSELVAGTSGAVCSDCAPHLIAELAKAGDAAAVHFGAVARTLEQLPPKTPLERSGPLLEAAIALARGRSEWLGWCADTALRLRHGEAALAALAATPADRTRVEDVLREITACHILGRWGRALPLVEGLDAERLAVPDRILRAVWAAVTRLRVDPTREAVPGALQQADEAARLLDAPAAEALDLGRVRLALESVRAECELRLGAPDLAEARLRAALAGRAAEAEDLLLLGDVLHARGELDAATDAWRSAVDEATPGTMDHRVAQERLRGVYR